MENQIRRHLAGDGEAEGDQVRRPKLKVQTK